MKGQNGAFNKETIIDNTGITIVEVDKIGEYFVSADKEGHGAAMYIKVIKKDQNIVVELIIDYMDSHNKTYRGEDLLATNHFSNIDNLYNAVRIGDFSDIWVGDYITYNNMKYIVMGINSYKNKNIVENDSNHLVIVPEHILISAKMNSSNGRSTGYINSEMHTGTLPNTYLPIMNAALGNHILNGTWALSANDAKATIIQTCKIRLLNEKAVYGDGNDPAEDMNTILPGFKLKTSLRIKNSGSSAGYWWLSSFSGNTSYDFVYVHSGGTRYVATASSSRGVVPMVLFG